MGMSELARLLDERLKKASNELMEARRLAKEANDRVDTLERRVERFGEALAEETGQEPAQPATETKKIGDDETTTPGINKAQIVRDVIFANLGRGVTTKDIREGFQKAGVTVHVNYPYAVIRRLKKNKTIREKNGRYYPMEPKKAGSE
jgi:hypothetical protein